MTPAISQPRGSRGLSRCARATIARPDSALPHMASIQPASVKAVAEFGLIRSERPKSSRARSRPLAAMFQIAKAAIQSTCASPGARSTARHARVTAAARSASLCAIQP